MKLTLAESVEVTPRKDFATFEEKYAFIAGELGTMIEKLIREGQFDISNSIARLAASGNSALSLIDNEIAARYAAETGYKLSLEYTTYVVVKTPTYLYKLDVRDVAGYPVSNVVIDLKYTYDATENTIRSATTTNPNGIADLNLIKIFNDNKIGLHPYYCNSFKVIIAEQEYEITKIDTNYEIQTIIIAPKPA